MVEAFIGGSLPGVQIDRPPQVVESLRGAPAEGDHAPWNILRDEDLQTTSETLRHAQVRPDPALLVLPRTRFAKQ